MPNNILRTSDRRKAKETGVRIDHKFMPEVELPLRRELRYSYNEYHIFLLQNHEKE